MYRMFDCEIESGSPCCCRVENLNLDLANFLVARRLLHTTYAFVESRGRGKARVVTAVENHIMSTPCVQPYHGEPSAYQLQSQTSTSRRRGEKRVLVASPFSRETPD